MKQAYKVIAPEDVTAALKAGMIPVQEVFLDARGREIGTGNIILAPREKLIRQIKPDAE